MYVFVYGDSFNKREIGFILTILIKKIKLYSYDVILSILIVETLIF